MTIDDAVAVVGLAARLPGAPTIDAYWRNLCAGVESIARFTDEELAAEGVDPRLVAHPRYVKAKPILDDVDRFDASLFGMSAREAEITDPQHRIFLELCHEALERAGCAPEQYRGAIGVFAGAGLSAYLLHHLSSGDEPLQTAGASLGIGNVQDFLATRVAYKLNLRGPAYSVQSACSTSLVAVHLACQNLLGYECDAALAGGVSLGLPMRCGYLYQDEGMMSPDGHCRPFDAAARGTVFGNGAGVVVLKRLADALADGDTIYAVVLGSAVNNDGGLKAGFTAPSVVGQASVIAEAIANADVEPDTIGYVEAHGTATILGDPIEIEGLTRAFRQRTDRRQFCAIGSVKSNIGHLDTAAGIAGFIKTVLALHHRALPPSLHFERPNPRIDFAPTPFFVNTALADWPTAGPRRAGVSAFGVGGTNAHVVLEEAPAPRASGPSRRWHVVPIAARSEAALDRATTALADFLDDHPDTPIADVAFTLQVGRRTGEHRRVTVSASLDETVDRLLDLPPQDVFAASQRAAARPLVFMFPGQGAQYAGMGAGLYADEAAYRVELERVSALLAASGGVDPLPLVLAGDADRESAARRLQDADAEQCALFAVEYAIARLWLSWGLAPEALVGLSLGEYAAATIAGVFTLEDACTAVAARARLMATLPPGAMLAVPLPPDAVREILQPAVSIALVNARASTVVSGDAPAIASLQDRLTARGVVTRRLDTRAAYHSPLVDAIVEPFAAAIHGMRLRPPSIPLVSSATGRLLTGDEAADPQYWVRQLRHPAYFAEGIRELLKDSARVFLEVGPGLTLASLTRQNADGAAVTVLSSLADQRERRPESQALMTTLAKLWLAGLKVDWSAFHAGERRRRVALPTYPFDRQRYWIEPKPPAPLDAEPSRAPDVADWFTLPSWTRRPLAPATAGLDPNARVLLLVGDDRRSRAIVDAVRARAADLTVATPGDSFARLDAGSFVLPPDSRDDVFRLVEALASEGRGPDVVVHAWAADAATSERGFYSLLWLGQALGARPRHPVRLAVVTPGIHAVVGGEALVPEAATLLGPAIVLGQEFPHLVCRSIDLDAADAAGAHILDEIEADDEDRVVAWRGGHRWVRRFEPMRLPHAAWRTLRTRGVYLITGGFGGMGRTLAGFLARRCQARLVLISRRPAAERGAAVAALEREGAEVMTVSADVASLDGMRAAVEAARARWGAIDGVIHAAGVAGGGLAALKTREAAARVLAPKVAGTLALERALGDAPLDFFVVCSSLAAIAGGIGQVDYCGANAFLDAWAQARAAAGRRAVSVNWDAWRDVGMAVDATVPEAWREVRTNQLELALSPDEGIEVFGRLLDRDYPQVAVSTVGLGARLRGARGEAGPSGAAAPRALHPRPNLTSEYVAPAGDLERRLAVVWQRVLGVEAVGALDNFFDLGGDSLTALRVVEEMRSEQALELSIAMFYATPTVRLLAASLDGTRDVGAAGVADAI